MPVNLHFPKLRCKSIKSPSSAKEQFLGCNKCLYVFFFFNQDRISDFKTETLKNEEQVFLPTASIMSTAWSTAGIDFNLPKITNTFEKLALALDFFNET